MFLPQNKGVVFNKWQNYLLFQWDYLYIRQPITQPRFNI